MQEIRYTFTTDNIAVLFTRFYTHFSLIKIVLFESDRFYLPRQGRPFLVDAYTPRRMFRILTVTCLLTRKALRLIIIPD